MPNDDEIAGLRKLKLTEAEIAAIFGPWTVERMPISSAGWRKIVVKQLAKYRRRLLRRELLGWVPGVRRTQETVDQSYSQNWTRRVYPSLDMERRKGETSLVEWRDEGFVALRGAVARPHLVLIDRMLELIRPESVLEVGAGNGTNLFVLSASRPEARFAGLELTATGVGRMQQVISEPTLPEVLAAYNPMPVRDREAYRRIEATQGSAAALPYPDKSFDVSVTITALEQMDTISAAALAELRRVTRRYVVMFEPYPDFNTTPLRSTYVRSKDYWSVPVSRLTAHGLEPVHVDDAFPHKLLLGVGGVVAVPK